MHAAILLAPRKLEIREIEEPEIGNEDVLVRVRACGICGSDYHAYEGAHPRVKYPIILGHEFSGVVEKVGSNVRSVREGDRVVVDPNITCGKCFYCRSGRRHFCEELQSVGINRQGAYAEYVAIPESVVYKIPGNISFEEACLTEPLACIIHGLDEIGIKVGESAVILGVGFIGLIFLQLLKRIGYSPIIVSEINDFRRSKAKELGADEVIDPTVDNVKDVVLSMTDGKGADLVIECTGDVKAFEQSLEINAPTGRILEFSVTPPNAIAKIRPVAIYKKELRIVGSFTNPYTMRRSIKLIERRIVNLSKLISVKVNLNGIRDILKRKVPNVIKALVIP